MDVSNPDSVAVKMEPGSAGEGEGEGELQDTHMHIDIPNVEKECSGHSTGVEQTVGKSCGNNQDDLLKLYSIHDEAERGHLFLCQFL